MLCIQFHCRCLSSLDTVSVFGIVLHHLSRAYLARPVYLPKDNRAVTGSPQTGSLQQPLQHLFRLVAIVGSKECGRGNGRNCYARFATSPHSEGEYSRWLSAYFAASLSSALLFACQKRNHCVSSVFRMLCKRYSFECVVIPTTAFVVTSADRWMQQAHYFRPRNRRKNACLRIWGRYAVLPFLYTSVMNNCP